MDRTEHLLTILAEECNEVAQRCTKALRFGLDDIEPGQPMPNRDRIVQEFNDLYALMEMLQAEDHIDRVIDRMYIRNKTARVEEYLKLSEKNGCLR